MARFKKKNISLVAFVIIIAVYALFVREETPQTTFDFNGENVYVHFIDVGQGDGAVIQTPEGNIIIDAGIYDLADETAEYIASLGITEFAYAIFTHPHADHIGGAATVIEEFEIDTVIMPDAVSTSATFEKMIGAIEDENCEVIEGKAGISLSLGEVSIDLLAPLAEYDDLNNMSIVSKLTFGNVSFLFTGDAESSSEYAMLEANKAALDSTVLKVGHHGSNTSSCREFLTAVSPEVAIYSCGLDNEYGHPHSEVVSRINSIGADVYRTDMQGNIVIETDGNTYSVITER